MGLLMGISVIGCATPYQRNGFSGGYSDNHLGNERHAIDVNVNSYTSQGTALQYAHRRATELCPSGYDVIDGAKSQSDFYIRTGNIVQNTPKSSVSLIVQCERQSVVIAATPAVSARPEPYAC